MSAVKSKMSILKMKLLETYIGANPFTVEIDASPQLSMLVEKARGLRSLPFEEKLGSLKQLTLDAMVNAYEQMIAWGEKANETGEGIITIGSDGKKEPGSVGLGGSVRLEKPDYMSAREQHARFKSIVFEPHPLSHALKEKAGCCRYQGALLFVLGYEADLGDKHFLEFAPIDRTKNINTVFNEIINDGKSYKTSMFIESLEDKRFDYTRQNQNIFEQAVKEMSGLDFYSYHRTPDGLVIVSNQRKHITELK